jgi:hypothetical protein
LPDGFCFGFCGLPAAGGPVQYHQTPAIIPNDMQVGDTLRVDVQFTDPASTGSVTWTTPDPGVATWEEPSPPCVRDRCRILRAVGRGWTQVTVGVTCSGGCGGKTITTIRVTNRMVRVPG